MVHVPATQSCSGTLISPTLVLTAAHCILFPPTSSVSNPFLPQIPYFLRSGFFTFSNADGLGDSYYPIQSAIIKREYSELILKNSSKDGYGKAFEEASKQGFDIAIISLSKAVTNVTPAQLYESKDEDGRVGTYVGFGVTGNGNGKNENDLGIKRAGQNRIKVTDLNRLGSDFDMPAPKDVYTTLFDCKSRNSIGVSPIFSEQSAIINGASSSRCREAFAYDEYEKSHRGIFDKNPTPVPYEYAVVAGDSGGGLFIGLGSHKKLAGVISAGDSNPIYGTLSYSTRVSQWVPWIDKVKGSLSNYSFPIPKEYTFVPDQGGSKGTPDRVLVRPLADYTLLPYEAGYDDLIEVSLIADIFSNTQDPNYSPSLGSNPNQIPDTIPGADPSPILGGDLSLDSDNASAAVPEPSTMMGVALAGAFLKFRRRSQRKKAE